MSAATSAVATLAPAERASHANSTLKQIGKRLGTSLLTIVIALVLLLAAWSLALHFLDVPKLIGKTPTDIWHYLFSDTVARGVRPPGMTAAQARSELWGLLGTTLIDSLLGFVFGLLAALVIASLFVLSKPFEFAFLPVAILLRSVPLVAMAPIIMLMFGAGKVSIVMMAAVVVLFPALINLVLGLRSASAQALDLIKVNGGSEATALIKVRIPSALPNFFAAVRISVPGSIVGAMLGEALASFNGLGGRISYYESKLNYSGVWAIVAVSVVISVLAYSLATIVETAVLAKWGPDAGRS